MRTALFALNAVLFPGGVMPLRVFEARYMDMVRACMKSGEPFGVVLILKGREVGTASEVASEGTFARIAAWDMPQFGLLNIRTLGEERFRITEIDTQPDGLKVAQVEPLTPDVDSPISARHQPCVALLKRIIGDLEERRKAAGAQAPGDAPVGLGHDFPFEPPYRFDSSVWVGNRLAESLPIAPRAKQRLMALPDAIARLDLVFDYLHEHGVIK